MSIHVAYASRHGATAEVAEAIAAELIAEGHDVNCRPIQDGPHFEGADAIVLGSAIYAGRWLKDARKLVRNRRHVLALSPLWLFSSGPTGDPYFPKDPEPADVVRLADELGARDHVVFGGKLETEALSLGERLVVKGVRAQDGDYRDWDQIAAWARGISAALRAGESDTDASRPTPTSTTGGAR